MVLGKTVRVIDVSVPMGRAGAPPPCRRTGIRAAVIVSPAPPVSPRFLGFASSAPECRGGSALCISRAPKGRPVADSRPARGRSAAMATLSHSSVYGGYRVMTSRHRKKEGGGAKAYDTPPSSCWAASSGESRSLLRLSSLSHAVYFIVKAIRGSLMTREVSV
jgi:hypothetical protein